MDMNASNIIGDSGLSAGYYSMSALSGDSLEGQLFANLQFAQLLNRMRQILMQQWYGGADTPDSSVPGNSGSAGSPTVLPPGRLSERGYALIKKMFGVDPMYSNQGAGGVAGNPATPVYADPTSCNSGGGQLCLPSDTEPATDGYRTFNGPGGGGRCHHQHKSRKAGENNGGGLIGNLSELINLLDQMLKLYNETKQPTVNDQQAFQSDKPVQVINDIHVTYNIMEFDA